MNQNKTQYLRPKTKIVFRNNKPRLPQLSSQKQKIQYKTKTKQSFQKNYADNTLFDGLIQSQYNKMLEEKQQTPSLIIPSNFQKFIKSKSFKELLLKVYEYSILLIQVENKYQRINNQLATKGEISKIKAVRAEISQLKQKCKQISFVYSGIILTQGDHRSIFKDQYFFETMLYFLTQILKQNFDKEEFVIIEEQISRIFRTNSFNLIKRRHQQDLLFKKYPALKETKSDSISNVINNILERMKIPKITKYEKKQKHQIKPYFIYATPNQSIRSRSPIMSLICPSQREKLFVFNQEIRDKQLLPPSHRYSQFDQLSQKQ